MNNIPDDILWEHIIKQLKTYDLLFVCKHIYDCYWTKIKENDLIMKRFNRLQFGYEEFLRTGKMVVRLDRIFIFDVNDKYSTVLYGRIFYDKSTNINEIKLALIHTLDKWATVNKYIGSPLDDNFEEHVDFVYSTHMNYHTRKPHLYKVWFAIEASYQNYTTYDNNAGWNYAVMQQYNWIPTIKYKRECDCENNNNAFCIDCQHVSFPEWCLTEPEILPMSES